jgi:hypothetical protein
MQNQLQKAIKLAKKTGDKLIIFDEINSENPYVVMSLEEYEKMIVGKSEIKDLTEQEMIDKINRDIAIWRNEQNFNQELTDLPSSIAPNFTKNYSNERENSQNDDTDFITAELDNRKKIKSQWQIPPQIKKNAEEVVENNNEYNEDEDRQYLEQITF